MKPARSEKIKALKAAQRHCDELDASGPSRLLFHLNTDDVVSGRGVTISRFEGNVRFRELIGKRKDEYVGSSRHYTKQVIADEIFQEIRQRDGRFVRQIESTQELERLKIPLSTDVWTIIPDSEAMTKIKQALREMTKNKTETVDTPTSTEQIVGNEAVLAVKRPNKQLLREPMGCPVDMCQHATPNEWAHSIETHPLGDTVSNTNQVAIEMLHANHESLAVTLPNNTQRTCVDQDWYSSSSMRQQPSAMDRTQCPSSNTCNQLLDPPRMQFNPCFEVSRPDTFSCSHRQYVESATLSDETMLAVADSLAKLAPQADAARTAPDDLDTPLSTDNFRSFGETPIDESIVSLLLKMDTDQSPTAAPQHEAHNNAPTTAYPCRADSFHIPMNTLETAGPSCEATGSEKIDVSALGNDQGESKCVHGTSAAPLQVSAGRPFTDAGASLLAMTEPSGNTVTSKTAIVDPGTGGKSSASASQTRIKSRYASRYLSAMEDLLLTNAGSFAHQDGEASFNFHSNLFLISQAAMHADPHSAKDQDIHVVSQLKRGEQPVIGSCRKRQKLDS